MSKFSSGLLRQVQEEQLQEQRQQKIRDKHNLDENTVVIEKTNTVKFLIRCLVGGTKACCGLILTGLAAAGAFTLLYSDLRDAFLARLSEVFRSIF